MSYVSMTIEVPFTPPSVNHYKKPRRGNRGFYVTEEAEAFKLAVALYAKGRTISAETYGAEIFVFLGKGQKGDIDNFAKVPLDALKDCGVIHSDAAINYLSMAKFRDEKNPRTVIKVWSRD